MTDAGFLLAALALAARAVAAEPVAVSYADLPARVAGKNGLVGAAGLDAQAARAGTGAYRRSWLPELSVTGGPEWYRSRSAGSGIEPVGRVEAALNVFRGGRDRLVELRNADYSAAAEADRETALRGELAAARTLYWDAVAGAELVAMLNGFRDDWGRVREGAARRAAAGQSTKTDILAFDLLTRQWEDEIEVATAEEESARAELAATLGFPPGTELRLVPTGSATALALATVTGGGHPLVDGMRHRASARARESAIAGRWWVPSLDLWTAASAHTWPDRSYAAAADRLEATAGVRLTLPLFDGGRSRREAAAARLRAEAESARAGHADLAIAARRAAAARKLASLGRLVRSAADSADRADEFHAATLREYDLGLRNGQDVLSAMERHVGLHRLRIERQREYGKAAAGWAALCGEAP